MIRLVLHQRNNGDTRDPHLFGPFKKGDQINENAVNNYDSFSDICKRFNATLKKCDKIDFTSIIEFRDAIAHGRLIGDGFNLTIIKFSKSKNKTVKVDFIWNFSENGINDLIEHIGKITNQISIKHLGAKSAP
jgi:hypothetical protein